MAKLVVVYKTIETEASKIVAYLENRCLHPVVLDDPETTGPYRGKSYEIRIAVPETERDRAAHLLDQKERQERLRLIPLVKRTNSVFFLIMAALILLAILVALEVDGMYTVGLGALLVAVVAVALIRQAWSEKPPDSSADDPDPE